VFNVGVYPEKEFAERSKIKNSTSVPFELGRRKGGGLFIEQNVVGTLSRKL
jgi:hypothetical protein